MQLRYDVPMRAGVWVVITVAACGDDGAKAPDAAPMVDAASADACVPGAGSRVVFLSKAGGTYSAGPDDSTRNVTSILNATTILSPPTVDGAEWTAFVSCVTSKFAPFGVTVTDVDPGTAQHMEVVVIDDGTKIGHTNMVFGLAPFTCAGNEGKVYDNGIAFVMWNVGATERCMLGAQMTGNLFGLDHSFSCPDLMTYLSSCGPSDNKTFTNMDVSCGEFSARNCNCGKATQNSYRTLAAIAGERCR